MHSASLRVFDTVARTGSLRRASEELHIAASALSRRIRKIEDEYEVRFFERQSCGLRLTKEGRLLLRHIRSTLSEHDILKANLRRLGGGADGSFAIAALDSLSSQYLPCAVSEYRRRNPKVNLDIFFARPSQILHLASESQTDICVTLGPTVPEATRLLHAVAMPIMALVGCGHPLAGRESVAIEECLQYEILLHWDSNADWPLLDEELSLAGGGHGPIVRSNSVDMMRQLIKVGCGVGFYTPIGAIREIREGSIVAVPLRSSRLSDMKLGLLVRDGIGESDALSSLLHHLRQLLNTIEADCRAHQIATASRYS